MDIKNSCVSNFGGIIIENECISGENGDKYLIVIGYGDKTLWEGSPADLEEMAAGHNYLKNACQQVLYAQRSGDSDEFNNALQSVKEALHRSGISMFEPIVQNDDDLPF